VNALIIFELTDRYLGTLRLYSYQTTTDWSSDVVNNRLLNAKGVKQLKDSLEANDDRWSEGNHMVATTTPENALKLWTVVKADSRENTIAAFRDVLAEHNNVVNTTERFPLVDRETWTIAGCEKLVLQSGQHRFAAVAEFRSEEKERWWPVKIYLEPVSEAALTRLRQNVSIVSLPQSDGERFLHLVKYRMLEERLNGQLLQLLAGSEDHRFKISQRDNVRETQRMKVQEFSAGSSTRVKQILQRPALLMALYAVALIPALGELLKFSPMGEILALRCQEVYTF